MSAAVSSANKANLFNEETEALYDPHLGFAIPSFYTEISWPEWNDAELNAEAWDEGKARAGTAVGGKKDAVTFAVPAPLFDDPDPPNLPLLIKDYVCSWKRPQQVFDSPVFSVYDPTNSEFVLTLSSTVADCDLFKAFSEQLPILQYYAVKYGFPVEVETAKFVANTQGEPWRPWHHVYALCKAGKGQVHKPLHCPFGKYVVRLFYMGAWRRILVDDKIPCDKDGNCMLPTTQVEGELWPIILTKALLKVASLTPSYDFSAIDFPLLSFFTAWPQGSFTALRKTDEQIWRRLAALVPIYELPEEPADPEAKSGPLSVRNLASKRESKKESRPVVEKRESQMFSFLLAALSGFPEEEDLFEEYTMAVTMIRDRPLGRLSRRESTKPWKRIRWVFWAKEKGIWTDEALMPPYRRIKNITFAKELAEFLAPDPRQEAVLYEPPEDEEEDAEDEVPDEEDKLFEPEQWCDYLKFKKHLSRMYVFLKPSCFTCSFKVTSLREGPPETPATGKSTGKAPPPQNVYAYPPVVKPTCNEPLFLFCESAGGIFVCFSFSIFPKKPKASVGYLEGDHPEVLKIGHGSLVVEHFLWRRIGQGDIIGAVRTVGNSVLGLNLKPGRHVLKLWLISDSPYVVDVYSNVNVVVHKHARIRLLLTSEPERVSNYVANVSNAFISLTLKFGKSDLPSALHDFYNSIRPGNEGIIGYRSKIDDFIEAFLNCVLLSLKELIPSTDELKIMMWALQALFFNPNIRCDLPPGGPPSSIYGGVKKPPPKKVITVAPRERTLSEILEYPWTPEEIDKVILVQRVFRGFKVRLLWKCQAPARKEFKPYVERLKKICDVMFAPPKREQEVGLLLRRIVMAKPDLMTTFRFHEDLCNVVQVEEFTGKLPNVDPFAWVPITRFIVASHSEEPVPCAFYFSCNLENFVLQGFDNDTNKEIFRLTNTVCSHYYSTNAKGYTIFAFGWNEACLKTVNWKLELVKMKYFRSVHLCNLLLDLNCHPYTMPTLDVVEVKNFYIPNSKSRVCRCFIKIQKRTLLTLRFSASYSEAHFLVTISLDKSFCGPGSETVTSGKVIARVNSTNGAVLMSSLVLDFVENPWWGEYYSETESTVYVVEVSVLHNSWPLTKQEWGVVEPLRVNGESWKDSTTSLQSKKGSLDSRKKLTRPSKRNFPEQKTVENPFWLIQVVNDSPGSEPGDAISIEEDKSHVEFVKAMKQSWEEKDPGRRRRGREMRMRFLYMIFLEGRNYEGEGEGEYGEPERGSEHLHVLMERMSGFSYLTSDTSPTRYRYSPRKLPVVPLFQLMCKYCRFSKALTEASEENEENGGELSERLKNLFEELEEVKREFLNQCVHFRSVMVNHTTAEQKLSNRLMEEAYESRQKAIERMMR